MYIVYYDESGDDGNPGASDLFVLCALRVHDSDFKCSYDRAKAFRSELSKKQPFPSRIELHSRALLLNKKPYCYLCLSEMQRVNILEEHIGFLASIPVNITNVVINKSVIKKLDYKVLDNALTYSIQRLENTIRRDKPGEPFMIITDDGRIEKMRRTCRQIQKINYIPNNNGFGYSNHPIMGLIEDPLPKPSDQSFFIQFCDMVSYMVNLFMKHQLYIDSFANKLPAAVTIQKIENWLSILDPVLNIAASKTNEYGHGIVCYPKK
jgi:hypothetical protein